MSIVASARSRWWVVPGLVVSQPLWQARLLCPSCRP
jgi:hypothetical protein